MPSISTFVNNLNRKKFVSFDSSPLSRTLTLIDLTALGIGSTVGVGFYILAGQVARETAGPAVVISFLIAGIASVFAGLCYAEFGARVPKAGSAYVYSYVCVGEFVAFVIGWNLLLEYVIGTASVARGYSAYIDDLANHSMSKAFDNAMHMDVTALADYPDFFAFGVTLLLTAILVVGVKESSRANNVFTGINIFVIAYVIIAGATQVDVYNWHLSEEDVKNTTICQEPKEDDDWDWGTGGFAPYGVEGIMQGAATCFFGFVGFDIIATTGEEAIRPEKNIPLSISISLLCIFLAYFGMSTVLTLALPYCMMDPDAPLIELFNDKGMMVSKWIVSIGAIFGFSASLLGAMFPMPRILYAMADDGLIFRFLAKIDKRFKTPAIATILAGFLAGIMALLFSLDALVDMMSIGTLMAYTIVSVCVMLLRYMPDNETDFVSISKNAAANIETKFEIIKYGWKDYIKQIFNGRSFKEPTQLSSSLVNFTTLSFSFTCFLLALFVSLYGKNLVDGDAGSIILVAIFFVLTLAHVILISTQPASKKKLSFQVPFVPWVPAVSTFINLYLMCNLSAATWIRFVFWMIIGFAIYFFYGIQHSSGSDVPKSKNTGKDYEGMEINIINKHIPPIIVQPPTPGGSRLGTPTNSVARSPSESTHKVDPVIVFNIDEKKETDSQYFDISPLTLEKNEHMIEESESEDENDKKINKLESTTVLVSASVYGNDDHNRDKKEDSHHSKSGASNDDSDNITIDSGVELNGFKDSIYPELKDFKEASIIEGKNTFDEEFKEITDKKTFDKEVNNIINSQSSVKKTSSVIPPAVEIPVEENKNMPKTSKPPLRSIKSVPLFEFEGEVPKSVFSITDSTVGVSSEPGTPKRMRKHPIKELSRASSFDNIPPSSLDSPLAKKVKNFTIIPVNVGSDSSLASEEHKSSPPSIATIQIIPPSEQHNKDSDKMMSDLNNKLKYLETQEKETSVKDDDGSISSTALMSLPLDPIRERGESKVSQTDINTVTDHLNPSVSTST